jgi:hypothetical protein
LRILNRLGYDANESRQQKGYYPFYGSYATFAEAEKAKRNQYKHNPEAWILIESYNKKYYRYIVPNKWFFCLGLLELLTSFRYTVLVSLKKKKICGVKIFTISF